MTGSENRQPSRPYILDTSFERRMHFTNDATQSAMLFSDPTR
jgi:hypothetical protein